MNCKWALAFWNFSKFQNEPLSRHLFIFLAFSMTYIMEHLLWEASQTFINWCTKGRTQDSERRHSAWLTRDENTGLAKLLSTPFAAPPKWAATVSGSKIKKRSTMKIKLFRLKSDETKSNHLDIPSTTHKQSSNVLITGQRLSFREIIVEKVSV